MTIGDRIKQRRLDLGISQEDLAIKIGTSKQAIYKYENNIVTNIPLGKIDMLASAMNTTAAYLMGWEDSDSEKTIPNGDNFEVITMNYKPKGYMPKLGRVAAGLPLFAEANIEGYIANDFDDEYSYYGLDVHGDSMNAVGIDDGDTVVIRQQDFIDENQIAVVLVNGDDATIKYYKQMGTTVILTPKSYNPEHQPQIYDAAEVPIKIIGRVVQVRKNF